MSFWSRLAIGSRRPAFARTVPKPIRLLIGLTAAAFVTSSTGFAQPPQSNQADTRYARPATPSPTNPGGVLPDAYAKPGVQTRVGLAWDCASPNIAPPIAASAMNGTVVVKRGMAPSCGRQSMHVNLIYYTSKPGFKGTDKLMILGAVTSGTIQQVMTIIVK